MTNKKIVLGSASPRRRQLLEGIYGDIEIRIKNVHEDFPGHLKQEQIALYLAEQKANAFKGEIGEGEVLITADTIVWLDDHVLNKPADRIEALQMLKELSGREHRVYTGVCVAGNDKTFLFYTESVVRFRKISDDILLSYIDEYKPYDKAGAYGAQECLPEGMNPLSEKERAFLKQIGKPELFSKSMSVLNHARIPLIDEIKGSYFNVMGLPVAELHEVIDKEF